MAQATKAVAELNPDDDDEAQSKEVEKRVNEINETRKRMSDLAAFAGFVKPVEVAHDREEEQVEPVRKQIAQSQSTEAKGKKEEEEQQQETQKEQTPPPQVQEEPAPPPRVLISAEASPPAQVREAAVDLPGPSPPKAAPKTAKQKAKAVSQKAGKDSRGKGKSKGKLAGTRETLEPSPEVATLEVQLPEIGAYVRSFYCGAEVFGTVLFAGRTLFAPGQWVGIDLNEPRTNHDGSMLGVQYFECKPSCGFFARASAVEQISAPERNWSNVGGLSIAFNEDSAEAPKFQVDVLSRRGMKKSASSPTIDLRMNGNSPINSRSRSASPGNARLPSSPPWSATSWVQDSAKRSDKEKTVSGISLLYNTSGRRRPQAPGTW